MGLGKRLTEFFGHNPFLVISRCKEGRERTAKQRQEGWGLHTDPRVRISGKVMSWTPPLPLAQSRAIRRLTPACTKAFIKVGQYPKSYCTMTDDQNPRPCRGAAGVCPAALLCFQCKVFAQHHQTGLRCYFFAHVIRRITWGWAKVLHTHASKPGANAPGHRPATLSGSGAPCLLPRTLGG